MSALATKDRFLQMVAALSMLQKALAVTNRSKESYWHCKEGAVHTWLHVHMASPPHRPSKCVTVITCCNSKWNGWYCVYAWTAQCDGCLPIKGEHSTGRVDQHTLTFEMLSWRLFLVIHEWQVPKAAEMWSWCQWWRCLPRMCHWQKHWGGVWQALCWRIIWYVHCK